MTANMEQQNKKTAYRIFILKSIRK